MEKELNIAAILKEKPEDTKLWSPIFGNCKLSRLLDSGIRVFPIHNGVTSTVEKSFFNTGRYTLAGEVCLFPSKQMLDWSKFAWKKGDVLESDNKLKRCIFEEWANDDYTDFNCFAMDEGWNDYFSKINNSTCEYHKADDFVTELHIKRVEKKFGGKLNLETLEIEHPKQEFKDGDILYSNLVGNEVFIVKIEEKGILHSYVYMDIYNKVLNIDKDETFAMSGCIYNGNIRLATDSEKQQLFSALEKEGKRWNPDTKSIEDLPKKCEFKPMDWCLMRDVDEVEYRGFVTSEWVLCQYSHYLEGYKFVAVGGNWFGECIPYNEETAHLLGTTDEWKGDE